MIKADFFCRNGKLTGFRFTGHSGLAVKGQDIVCAAVSSAAYLTANTITEILQIPAEIRTEDGFLSLRLSEENAQAQVLFEGLLLHMEQLREQNPESIRILKINQVKG